MAQVYNYLIQSNQPFMRHVKYTARRNNDLKKIYSNIVNISRHSPVYKINLSKENQEYTIGIKETAIALKSRLYETSEADNPCFLSRKLSVSNDKLVSAKLLNQETDSLDQTTTIKINHLASAQINKGNEIYDKSHGVAIGDYEFDVRVLDKTYSLSFKQPEKTENIDTMSRIVDYLNDTVPEINAYLKPGSHNNYSYIMIESNIKGDRGETTFELYDKQDSRKGIVDYFDLNHIEHTATNTNFEINGIQKETVTNQFTIDDTLSVSLFGTSEEAVTIKIIPDSNKIQDQIKSVISTYNSLLNLAKNHSESSEYHYRSKKLIAEMKYIGTSYKEELESCGLEFDDYGRLSINDNLFYQAAIDGGIESLFTRDNGFVEKLQERLDAIIINPMDYLDKIIITYPGNDRTSFANPYITSIYSGMLFNSYC